MKIRNGFVSNSSSSSFVVVYRVLDMTDLYKYMSEEYGKFGKKLVVDYVWNSSDPDFKLKINDSFSELLEFEDDNGLYTETPTDDDVEKADAIIKQRKFRDEVLNKKSGNFIFAKKYAWTTEGDTEGVDAFFVDQVKDKPFVEFILETEPD